MTGWTDVAQERVPVDELARRARDVRPGRVLLTVISAIGVAIGWAVGMFFRSIGWLSGRVFLVGAYFTETVIFGFREGAGIPQPVREPPPGTEQPPQG